MNNAPFLPGWIPARSRSAFTLLFLLLGALTSVPALRAANLPPKIMIFEPQDSAVFYDPDEIKIACHVEDADGSIVSAELLMEDGSLGKLTPNPAAAGPMNPFFWIWQKPPAGEHKLVVQAIDNEGASAFSESIVVYVKREQPVSEATLTVTEPAPGSAFASGSVVPIKVTAVDPNGDIRHVEFYANGRLIGRSDHWTKDAVIPGRPREHSLEWGGASVGRYELAAKAVDTKGIPVQSRIVPIVVGTPLPLVSLTASVPQTSEPGPTIRVIPGAFTLKRDSGIERELTVYLAYDGSATPDVDYDALPKTVTFAPGVGAVDLSVVALQDSLVEGVESVVASLIDPGFDRLPDHVIDPDLNTAKVLIQDQIPRSNASLVITAPKDGEVFRAGDSITISATAIDPEGYIARVEFFAGEKQIGVSEITFIRAPDPGTPIYHSIEWQEAPAGEHVLTVRAIDSKGALVRSEATYVKVTGGTGLPTVQIAALDSRATEFSPFVDAVDPARFIISRDGDVSKDLLVVFSLHGSAKPDRDYRSPGRTVTISAGKQEVEVQIVPISDEIDEPMETVVIRLQDPMPISSLPGPVTPYEVAPYGGEATAVIFDRNEPAKGAVAFALPDDGATYYSPQPINLLVAAFHPQSDLNRVEFYAEDNLIGVSEIVFNNIVEAGLILHPLLWKEPAPGEHTLTARAKLADGSELVSDPVHITVRSLEPDVVLLGIVPLDGFAVEVGSGGEADPASLSIRRMAGPRDVEVTVFYDVAGSARNGIDYTELPGSIVLPAGQESVELVIRPIPDKALEGTETIEVKLNSPICPAIYPPPPWCYQIRVGTAKVVLVDQTPQIQDSAKVSIVRPQHGAVVTRGDGIEIVAMIDGPAGGTGKLEILADDRLLASGEFPQLAFKWTDAPVGTHVLLARAVDGNGHEFFSEPLKVLVRENDITVAVRRELPSAYRPGEKFGVKFHIDPSWGAGPSALEDQPPAGWAVSDVANDGAFDEASGRVKFGLFEGLMPGTLTYSVTPPLTAVGVQEFKGTVSTGGRLAAIGGNRLIGSQLEQGTPPDVALPAVLKNINRQINGNVRFQMSGPVDQEYVLEVSSDLVNWTRLAPVFLPDGQIVYQDEASQNQQQRFYRTRVP